MKYAVIASGGKQYKVSEGSRLLIDQLSQEKNSTVIFPEVLLVRDEDKIMIGTPNLTQMLVLGQIIGNVKGDKIRVSKFKAKVHYRRTTGFRSKYNEIQIEKIGKKGLADIPKINTAPKKK